MLYHVYIYIYRYVYTYYVMFIIGSIIVMLLRSLLLLFIIIIRPIYQPIFLIVHRYIYIYVEETVGKIGVHHMFHLCVTYASPFGFTAQLHGQKTGSAACGARSSSPAARQPIPRSWCRPPYWSRTPGDDQNPSVRVEQMIWGDIQEKTWNQWFKMVSCACRWER